MTSTPVEDLSVHPIDATIGDRVYRYFRFLYLHGQARLYDSGRALHLDVAATVERVGPRIWTVTPTDDGPTWIVADSKGCDCHGSRIDEVPRAIDGRALG